MRGKFLLSFGFIIISAAYAVWQSMTGIALTKTLDTSATPSQSYKAANEALLQTLSQLYASGTTATFVPAAPGPQTAPGPMMGGPMMRRAFVDGSYTGTPADAYYGTVQVKAIIQNGKIADVQFLQYPNDRPNSRFINDQAMPLLTQEAIVAQSAQVDGVSGATFTSQAFQQSLASALVLAKN